MGEGGVRGGSEETAPVNSAMLIATSASLMAATPLAAHGDRWVSAKKPGNTSWARAIEQMHETHLPCIHRFEMDAVEACWQTEGRLHAALCVAQIIKVLKEGFATIVTVWLRPKLPIRDPTNQPTTDRSRGCTDRSD